MAFGSPSIPATPPPPPMLQQPNVTATGLTQRQNAMGATGEQADILTSGSGTPGAAITANKTLLGS